MKKFCPEGSASKTTVSTYTGEVNSLALSFCIFSPLKEAQLGNLVSHEQTQQPKENMKDDGEKQTDGSGEKDEAY